MTFDLDHWRKPRQTIATRYQNDDIAYATHGAMVAMECVRRLEIPGAKAASMHLLDYGCGTGRMARVLAGYFGRVTAFDPVSECIAAGINECGIPIHNIAYTDRFDHLLDQSYDVIISVNVLEHLRPEDQRVMLETVKRVAKPGAVLLLWYAIRANRQVMQEFFGRGPWIEEDDNFILNHPECNINTRVFLLS
jgi:2-polyprenyl-6-hydroxyphenyl methylase / 3-demethylubiquinone-9 3-methyltransferase